jgi:hypothetical protein
VPRLLPALALALPLAACDKPPPPPPPTLSAADKQEVADLVALAQKKADAYKATRDDGLRRAWQTLEVPSGGSPCPEKLPRLPPLADEDAQISPADREAFDFAHFHMNVVPAWAVLGAEPPEPLKMMQRIEIKVATKGPRRDQFERQSEMLLRMVREDTPGPMWKREKLVKLAREIGDDAYWGTELDIVASVDKHALYDASETFEAGLVAGKAFLWSFKEGKVVCAASVTATNQERIKLKVNPEERRKQEYQRLHDDLKNEAYRAAIAALVAVP